MTERKPPHLSFPDWVDHQIRTAEAAGAFDDLPGRGKPLSGLDRAQDELAWVANYLRREKLDVAGLLPPSLALAKEVEDLPVRLLAFHGEDAARALVTDLNGRIDRAWAAPQTGPPFRVKRVDEDVVIAEWRETRAELLARRREAAAERAADRTVRPDTSRRRRWFGGRRVGQA